MPAEAIVLIPTYNEVENIGPMVEHVMGLPSQLNLLVIDDGSPDGTGARVKALQTKYAGRLYLMEREGKAGLGTAYIAGMEWALEKGYTYIFEMDADFSHNPDDLERLLHAVRDQGNHVAIGSRYVKGVNVVNWPMGRVMMSWFASKYVRYVTGMPFNDSTAGFKCYHRTVLETIGLSSVKFVGYAFQIEMKFKAWKHGFRVAEVPIVFTDRTRGTSKMSTNIFKEAIFGVLLIKLRSLFQRYQPAQDQES